MYFVYILQSEGDKSLYVGTTENVKQRVDEHNSGKAKYSRSKRPYALKWFCAFPLPQGSLFALLHQTFTRLLRPRVVEVPRCSPSRREPE